jgi:glucoamylase
VNPGEIHRCVDEDPNLATIWLPNQAPGARAEFPAKEIVDCGFLELVRYGIRDPHDPIIEDSIRVIDAVLKVDTPVGPCWHRYNHDGYGEREDGLSYVGWGKGRAWPLLTGERGHYEVAAGRDATPHLRALEGFAHGIGLIPEQIWDAPDCPERHFRLGGPTNAAVPLVWAHSEYVKLYRSQAEGKVFDLMEPVVDRYVLGNRRSKAMDVWKFNRRIETIPTGTLLRIQAASPFRLRWTANEWQSVDDVASTSTGVGIEFIDIMPAPQSAPIRFTFFWVQENRWEDERHSVEIRGVRRES